MNEKSVFLETCREGCAACCIVPSITTPLPGMPEGKPAGVPCIHLDENLRCRLYGKPERPSFCVSLKPSYEMCGQSREEAWVYLTILEEKTRPQR
ncbi:YkgJ family cysteine cluster protein [Thermospira aquatica]|uniref:YkgJ family cysteine cluster protein n=1 Tax=Thermospira aquatica TaxID=2828656 RepID=A0AAX3BEL2_9SPIR|nr:YkgJ family cysteine cluster protein [Thermospira aquatica]URA10783.1 YkgJ family cysteine cluster protein [Thermospira aquatica]